MSVPIDKEEKALEMVTDAIINRCQDLKNIISSFIMKLENESLNWPHVLDNFALISGQVNTVLKILRNEKTPPLRNRILLPLVLSPDRDDELVKLTENRVHAFNHEIVPDYLRTKPDPEVESREQQFLLKSHSIPMDIAQKQITAITKIVNNILDTVKANRDAWENDSGQRASATQTSSLADTSALICAITVGKGLKPTTGSPKGQPTNPQPPPQQPTRPASGGKVPSGIKTNIKSAASMHPYAR
ncbi:mediator of RNA polymerase II transcription subunit 8 [Trichonephila inaurata madagascariensis]|uniref:Mediator of RNA polymerase II transcription subunit 8 n=1 Tax=Trichonephila inaurata madagascariensis TaxID=2747483 RepID=A0A8X6ML01_9ARAC|nr:mediator of RNA polymerase II transcription subunit 8 [Trichonephila inaurata madagascariensis]